MIEYLQKLAIFIFLTFIVYDMYNLAFNGPAKQNSLIFVRREIEVPRKAEEEIPKLVPNVFDIDKYTCGVAIGFGLVSIVGLLLAYLCLRRKGGVKTEEKGRDESKKEKCEEEKAHIVIIKNMGQKEREDCMDLQREDSSRTSDLSSLYEDVMSRNLIDVLFIKDPQEVTQILPVNLIYSNNQVTCELEKNPQNKNEILDGVTVQEESNEDNDTKTSPILENFEVKSTVPIENEKPSVEEIPEIIIPEKDESSVAPKAEENAWQYSISQQQIVDSIIQENRETLERIEIKQYDIDDRLLTLEDKASKWNNIMENMDNETKIASRRMNIAESELSDLHEKMYTILSKLEEKPKQNYIVLSSMSKEAAMLEEDAMNGIYDVESTLTKYITQGYMGSDSARSITQTSDAINAFITKEKSNYINKCMGVENGYDCARNSRSIGLEAIFDLPRAKKTYCKVPTHIIPPYKRSRSTSTNSMGPIRRVRRKPCGIA